MMRACDKMDKINKIAGGVLVVGSGPDAQSVKNWPLHLFEYIVVINNAWKATDAWTHLIYPHDFPKSRLPMAMQDTQYLIDETQFVPAQNKFGGFVYAGGTMAFTAAYWGLDALRPNIMGFIGCDMHYPKSGKTHFYGKGTPDPLRKDISLTSLEACSARFYCLAYQAGCAVWNFSTGPSKLLYPRMSVDEMSRGKMDHQDRPVPNARAVQQCRKEEKHHGYMVQHGRYWLEAERFDENVLKGLDQKWRRASNLK